MDAVSDIVNETDFVEVDEFLNAAAAHAKDLGLEADTAVEVGHPTNVMLLQGCPQQNSDCNCLMKIVLNRYV